MKFLSIEKEEIFLWEKKIIHYTIQLNSLKMKDDVGGFVWKVGKLFRREFKTKF